MSLGEKIREQRKQAGLSQEQLAEKLNVSRQAITKWETDKGIPDVANLIAISDEFELSLDELIKGNVTVKKKIIADSSAKKWHILVIVYLLAIVAYVAYFAVCHRILMIGFLIATMFILFFRLQWSGAADVWNGGALIGTNRVSISIFPWGRSLCLNGQFTVLQERHLRIWQNDNWNLMEDSVLERTFEKWKI